MKDRVAVVTQWKVQGGDCQRAYFPLFELLCHVDCPHRAVVRHRQAAPAGMVEEAISVVLTEGVMVGGAETSGKHALPSQTRSDKKFGAKAARDSFV